LKILIKHPDVDVKRIEDIREIIKYDDFYKKLRTFHATRVITKYIDEEYIEKEDGTRIPYDEATEDDKKKYKRKKISHYGYVPEIHNIVVNKKEIDNKKVFIFIQEYTKYNDIDLEIEEVNNNGCVININNVDKKASMLDAFLYDLDRQGFRIEV